MYRHACSKRICNVGVSDNFRNICVYIPEKAGNPDVDTREATPLSEETYPAKGPRR